MNSIYIRKATTDDIPEIVKIIDAAKEFLKAQSIDQWQEGYPNIDNIKDDIMNDYSYVLIYDNLIAGTAALIPANEPTYNHIDGQWLNNNKYSVIHRIAISNAFHGRKLSNFFMSNLISCSLIHYGTKDVRIDTHPDNKIMQHVILSNGFKKCGIIYLANNDPRFAYQLDCDSDK